MPQLSWEQILAQKGDYIGCKVIFSQGLTGGNYRGEITSLESSSTESICLHLGNVQFDHDGKWSEFPGNVAMIRTTISASLIMHSDGGYTFPWELGVAVVYPKDHADT